MGERDAFGREKGEDALAQMGWKSGAPAWQPPPVKPGDPLTTPEPSAFDAGEAGSPFARPEPAPKAPAPSVFSAGEATAPFARPKPRPAEPEPVGATAAPAARAPGADFTRRPRRRGPSLARLIFVVGFVGVLAIGATKAVRVGGDAFDGIRDKIKAIEPELATP